MYTPKLPDKSRHLRLVKEVKYEELPGPSGAIPPPYPKEGGYQPPRSQVEPELRPPQSKKPLREKLREKYGQPGCDGTVSPEREQLFMLIEHCRGKEEFTQLLTMLYSQAKKEGAIMSNKLTYRLSPLEILREENENLRNENKELQTQIEVYKGNIAIAKDLPKCWWIFNHDWLPWRDKYHPNGYKDYETPSAFQFRVCSKCNKQQERYSG